MFEIVVIGASLGGMRALTVLLSGLPAGWPLAVAIVQHRHKDSGDLVDTFQEYSALPIVEVEDKMMIVPGRVYLAPSDYHLLAEPGSFALSTEAPVLYARPSIDLLFETVSSAYSRRAIGVILTGASHDGAQGLRAIKARGGFAIVQDPATAECRVMPAAALAATTVDRVLPLAEIAPFLVNLCQTTLR